MYGPFLHMRKLTFKIETVTKIFKASYISKFKNMGHRKYEHRNNSRRTKLTESKRVVRWLASAK